MNQCEIQKTSSRNLVHRSSVSEVNLFPLAVLDAGTNLRRRFAGPGHFIAVIKFLQACAAVRAVLRLEAAMQTLVTDAAITETIARLLVDHVRDLRRQAVSLNLITKLEVWSRQLLAGEDRRQ